MKCTRLSKQGEISQKELFEMRGSIQHMQHITLAVSQKFLATFLTSAFYSLTVTVNPIFSFDDDKFKGVGVSSAH